MEVVDYAYAGLCAGIFIGAAVGFVFGDIFSGALLGFILGIPIIIIAIKIKDPKAFSRKPTKKELEYNANWSIGMDELRMKMRIIGAIIVIIVLLLQFYRMTQDPVFIRGMAAWNGQY